MSILIDELGSFPPMKRWMTLVASTPTVTGVWLRGMILS